MKRPPSWFLPLVPLSKFQITPYLPFSCCHFFPFHSFSHSLTWKTFFMWWQWHCGNQQALGKIKICRHWLRPMESKVAPHFLWNLISMRISFSTVSVFILLYDETGSAVNFVCTICVLSVSASCVLICFPHNKWKRRNVFMHYSEKRITFDHCFPWKHTSQTCPGYNMMYPRKIIWWIYLQTSHILSYLYSRNKVKFFFFF